MCYALKSFVFSFLDLNENIFMTKFLRIQFFLSLQLHQLSLGSMNQLSKAEVAMLPNNACPSQETGGLVQFRERQRIAPFLEILFKEQRAFGHIERRVNHLQGEWMFLRGDPKLVLLTWVQERVIRSHCRLSIPLAAPSPWKMLGPCAFALCLM